MMRPSAVIAAVAAVAAEIAVAGALLACGHADRPPQEPTAGSGSATTTGRGGPCDAMRARVEQLYRAEAKSREPARVDEAPLGRNQPGVPVRRPARTAQIAQTFYFQWLSGRLLVGLLRLSRLATAQAIVQA